MENHFHADFYGFALDSDQGLSFNGKAVELHPKEFKLLLELIKNAGKRVSKEQLIASVWNNRPTSDESISRCLSILKSRLREASPGSDTLIKTEYGQGYRFIGQIGLPTTFVNEENFFLLMNSSRDLVTLKDSNSRWQIANEAALRCFGLLDKPWQGKTDRELALLIEEKYQPILINSERTDLEAWKSDESVEFIQSVNLDSHENQKRFYNITKTPMFEANHSRKALIMLGQDITDRIENEQQNQLIKRVLAHSDEAVLICDANANIVYINDAFTRITGYTLPEVSGQNPRIMSSKRHEMSFFAEMWRHIINNGSWYGEVWDKRKNGELYLKWLNISVVHDFEGAICNFVGMFTDLSKRKTDEAELAFLSYHDSLTKLPNLLFLQERFQQWAAVNARHCGGKIALLHLELSADLPMDHELANQQLIAIIQGIQTCIREVDILCRIADDKFAIVLLNMPDSYAISLVAQKVLLKIRELFEIDYQKLSIFTRIGIAIYRDDSDDFAELQKLADIALYNAKQAPQSCYRFYTEKMNIAVQQRLMILNGLNDALNLEQLLLFYQPQFNLSTGNLIGVEALIRWQHPESGLLLPDQFIPIAEETGQIHAIGEWVIREVCRQTVIWQQAQYEPVKVAINLSGLQLRHCNLIDSITNIALEYNLDPKFLELELNESLLCQDTPHIADIVRKIRHHHFSFSIDDFGTGYANLAYLKQFRVDKLKIDKSFINNLEFDSHDVTIVRTIIQLANGFGIRTVAEGIETLGQLEFLRNEGCQEGQGFLFARPLPAEQVTKHLKLMADVV